MTSSARRTGSAQARPYPKALPFLADSGCKGAGAGVLVPVRKPARGELEIDVNTPNALLRFLRYQGERGFALTKQRWRALQHVWSAPARSATLQDQCSSSSYPSRS
jgi:hypothetical protein